MNRTIIATVTIIAVAVLGVVAANTHVARGVIFPVTAYEADVNKDTRVNVADLGLVASKYGQIAPTATPTPTSYCDFSGKTFPSSLWLTYNGGGVLAGQPGFPANGGFSDCKFVGMTAIGPSLGIATFRRADFTNANIIGCACTWADFQDAIFVNANLSGGEYPLTSFVNANLTNANLSQEPPTSKFYDAVFTGAITTGANVTGVIWGPNTTCPDGTNSDDNGGSCIGHGFAGTPLATYTPTPLPTDTPTATATATPVPCVGADVNAVWTAGNGHCYQLFTPPTWFANARSDCELRGGYLVTLTSAVENGFVFASVSSGSFALIGLTDEVTEGAFLWVTGEPTAYTNWNPGEPNSVSGNEDAAVMNAYGTWNDLPDSPAWEFQYICETP